MKFFVYGTLRKGETNHHVIAPFVAEIKPGLVQGIMYTNGSFPYLIPSGDPEHQVVGEWVTVCNRADALKRMDLLEGFISEGNPDNHYDRVLIRDVEDGEEGYAYIPSHRYFSRVQQLSVISSGDWKYRDFTVDDLPFGRN